MNARGLLRLLVGALGLACAGALAFYYHRPRAAAPPAIEASRDPDATIESSRGNSLQWKGDQEQYQIQFEGMTGYADGRTRFREPHYTMTMVRDNREVEIWADTSESKGKAVQGPGPGNIVLTGHVRIQTSDHWRLQSDTATYDDPTGRMVMPGPVTFSRDRLSGQGIGAIYTKTGQVLELGSEAHIVMAPDSTGAGALDARAAHMVITRDDHIATLDGDTRLVREHEIIAADSQTLYFTPDEKGLRRMELRGHSSVVPQPGVAGAPPEMRADNADLTLHPDGHTLQHAALSGKASIKLASDTGPKIIRAPVTELWLAPDGQTLTRLDAKGGVDVILPATPDEPARTIDAATLTAVGDEKAGLQTALFSGSVTFVEHVAAAAGQPASERTGTSHVLATKLNGDLGAIDVAEFRDDVHFTDDDVDAVAPHATYHESKGDLVLDAPGAHSQPRVINSHVIVDATGMTVSTITHDVDATGAVQTKTRPAAAAQGAPPSTGLFDESKPTFGSAAHLLFANATQRATYTGTKDLPARISQDDSEVRGDTVIVDQTTNDLHASGHVSSTFVTDATPATTGATPSAATPPGRDHVTADEMTYTDATRLTHYVSTSGLVRLERPDGVTTAKTIDLVLAKDSRTIDRMVADGAVFLTSPPSREARGDHLVYEAATDRYVLTGLPAMAKMPDNGADPKTTTCTLSTSVQLTFASGGGADLGSVNGGQQTKMPCDKPLPPIGAIK